MKLSGLISPGIWDLLERLRHHLDVSLELFDAAGAPLLTAEDDPAGVGARLRQLGAAGESAAAESPAGRMWAALRTAQHHVFAYDGLCVGLFPLRRDRTAVGLLVTAASALDSSGVPDASAERRVERVGWSVRSTLEADIATGQQLSDEQHLSRWLGTILSFTDHLHGCTSEDDLFDAVVQAAAIWGDFDARVYERDLADRYMLRTALPSLVGAAPHAFGLEVVQQHPGVTRISSIAELEALGWHAPSGELLLVPIPTEQPPRWLLVVGGTVDERFERVFAVLSRTLGACLDRLVASSLRALDGRLVRRLADTTVRFPAQATAVLSELATSIDAAHARVLLRETDDEAPRVLAAVGGTTLASLPVPPHALDDARGLRTAQRLTLPLNVGLAWPAHLDLISATTGEFGPREARMADEAAHVVEVWLGGALKGLADAARTVLPGLTVRGFETRIADEVERARRFGLELGLLVIDTVRSSRDRHALALTPIVAAIKAELRNSDLVGRLDDGILAALLVHIDARGVAAVGGRVAGRLATLTAEGTLERAAVGRATYPSAGDSAPALLSAARQDLARQALSDRPAGTADRRAAEAPPVRRPDETIWPESPARR